jgi:tRNASer (uridine44-2'-O)-methyltransferase
MNESIPPRPKCQTMLVDAEDSSLPSIPISLSGLSVEDDCKTLRWITIGTCLAHFDCDTWLHVMRQLILHPERNSSNILRADILSEESSSTSTPPYTSETVINRLILPRRPNLDAALRQTCKIHRDEESNAIVVYTPQLDDALPYEPSQIPYYHPKVRSIAFQYRSRSPVVTETQSEEPTLADLFISLVPFECDKGFNAIRQETHRLSRTVISLLETQAQHSWGSRHHYQKRVIHDTLLPRNEYLDLYISLKEKYAGIIIDSWVESTDPKKHVFEDIGIAAFIILLWKETVRLGGTMPSSFVDVGCGNGLLVHLLNAEGYTGFGFDLQLRKSWAVWRGLPGGADLRVISLDAPRMVQEGASIFPPSSFLIGNHADELTSWLPLLAHSAPNCQGFLNIPCCPFHLNGEIFGNTKYTFTDDQLARVMGRSTDSNAFQSTRKEFDRGPPTQSTGASTRNVTYLRYLSHLHLQTGWHLEKEALRIPSTKNWALVGRRRVWRAMEAVQEGPLTESTVAQLQGDVEEEVQRLSEEHGSRWKARLPPGKEKEVAVASH